MMDIKVDDRPMSPCSNPGTDDSRSEPDGPRSPPPKLKMGALDIANMIAKHKPAPTSPIAGSPQISPLATTMKPLDLSQYTRLPVPTAFKGGFHPYQAGVAAIPQGLSVYPYNADTAASLSAAAAAGTHPSMNGATSLPMYSYPLAETGGTPSVSTLRLSALLASRKRRSTGSTSGDSNDSEDKGLDSGTSRKKVRPVPEEKKDSAYWERRRKNNDAAKRSRDARRMKEEEIALRAVFLEQDNMKLRAEVSILKSELARLHYMFYNH